MILICNVSVHVSPNIWLQELADNIGKPFWEEDPKLWDDVNVVGLKNNYFCSVYAARMMVPQKNGLIINISSLGAVRYMFNVCYGVGKCAVDRMSADMAIELRDHNVTVISLWPGIVKTELFGSFIGSGKFDSIKDAELLKSLPQETPEFSGKAVIALATDPQRAKKTGKAILAADVGVDYKFKDIDGSEPGSLRAVKSWFSATGYQTLAYYTPSWLRVPTWVMTFLSSRLQ
ncbi:unnamed protein product [Enterobius vermicularis]|uniref:Dehydrogenase/reductase SDR family member 1 n=1 Tax=Enterobius vermicularis TaxID=51028 RepID=A0A3P6HQA4_ENTVE|nr:unnamed protein product [Enterobius vermicularis]